MPPKYIWNWATTKLRNLSVDFIITNMRHWISTIFNWLNSFFYLCNFYKNSESIGVNCAPVSSLWNMYVKDEYWQVTNLIAVQSQSEIDMIYVSVASNYCPVQIQCFPVQPPNYYAKSSRWSFTPIFLIMLISLLCLFSSGRHLANALQAHKLWPNLILTLHQLIL